MNLVDPEEIIGTYITDPLATFERGVFDARESVGLAVKFELGMTPWVELTQIVRSNNGSIVARGRCGLVFLLAERAPGEKPLDMPLADVEDLKLTVVLKDLARQVQQYAADVLGGDFTIFPRCRIRAQERLRRED